MATALRKGRHAPKSGEKCGAFPFYLTSLGMHENLCPVTAALVKFPKTGDHLELAQLLKTEYIDRGTLGRETGEGYYTYPHLVTWTQTF